MEKIAPSSTQTIPNPESEMELKSELSCARNYGAQAAKNLRLVFGAEIPANVQKRMTYALQVLAAIYGYQMQEGCSREDETVIVYGNAGDSEGDGPAVFVPVLYRDGTRKYGVPTLRRVKYAGETFHLSFGVDKASGKPDWLGEIFEWLSSTYEAPIAERDAVGRIAYEETVFGNQQVSPRKAHCARLMAWFANVLQGEGGPERLLTAESPWEECRHAVICSHDVDFYFNGRKSALIRLIKNLGIACRIYKSWSYFRSNTTMILELCTGARVGEYLPRLQDAIEGQGFRSTIFVVARNGNRRDPNYEVVELAPELRSAGKRGFEVGLHGSYNSIVEERTLAPEVLLLETVTGRSAECSRQHWLRFDRHEELFAAIEDAELLFDSSLGFPEEVGFRNGANFAFPPYNFKEERAYEFLEIPLVLMDGGLEAAARRTETNPQQIADEVLAESRRWGWGGMAILWHNPMETLSVPQKINDVFWNCAKKRGAAGEIWMSCEEFKKLALKRYQDAGLLQKVT